jgi:hypothetical protein
LRVGVAENFGSAFFAEKIYKQGSLKIGVFNARVHKRFAKL